MGRCGRVYEEWEAIEDPKVKGKIKEMKECQQTKEEICRRPGMAARVKELEVRSRKLEVEINDFEIKIIDFNLAINDLEIKIIDFNLEINDYTVRARGKGQEKKGTISSLMPSASAPASPPPLSAAAFAIFWNSRPYCRSATAQEGRSPRRCRAMPTPLSERSWWRGGAKSISWSRGPCSRGCSSTGRRACWSCLSGLLGLVGQTLVSVSAHDLCGTRGRADVRGEQVHACRAHAGV